MSARARTTRSVLLSLAIFGLACTDATTGIGDGGAEERVIVSVAGVVTGDAGIVLQLSGAVQSVEPARHALDVAWSTDAGSTTVAVVGVLTGSSDLLVVRRRAGAEPLRAEVVEVATVDGALSEGDAVRLTIRRPTN